MATTLKTKNSVTTTVVPTTLQQGELAVNITDKKLWVGNAATTPVQLLGAGVTGDVVGPASATDNALARFDLTTGKLIQNSIGILSDAGALSGLTDVSTGTLSATGVATFSAGTVSLPAITTTGDTNTGIFFPAADTIAFTEGGVESMRIDSSGNVGIGTTSPSFAVDVVRSGGDAQLRLMSQATGTNGIIFRNNAAPTSAKGAILYPNGSAIGGDTMQFVVDAAERMRIDSSGNVGIGTSSPNDRLDIVGGNVRIASGNVIRFVDSGNVRVSIQGDTSSNAIFNTAGSERMRIDSGGNVGIGTSSPSSKLEVSSATGNTVLTVTNTSGTIQLQQNVNDGYINMTGTGNIVFRSSVSYVERMRIDSSGNLLVGTTSNLGGGTLDVYSTARAAGFIINNSSGSQDAVNIANQANAAYSAIRFWVNGRPDVGSLIGSISCTTSATAYNTSSDYRLKENIAPMTGALAKVSALKPVTYTWKADGSDGQGFIAHELQEVVPDAVTGKKDAVNEDGSIKPQGVDTSFLVATLTSALQELHEIVKAQAAEIALLKSK